MCISSQSWSLPDCPNLVWHQGYKIEIHENLTYDFFGKKINYEGEFKSHNLTGIYHGQGTFTDGKDKYIGEWQE